MMLLGLSRRPADPLNPLESNPPPPDLTTLAVGRGFRTVKPDLSGLVVSFAFQNLWNLTWTDNFNVSDEILSIPDQIRIDFVEIRRDLAVI